MRHLWLIPLLLSLSACDQWKKLTGLNDTPLNPPTETPAPVSPPAAPPVVLEDHIIIISGQSNMLGVYDKYNWVNPPNMKLLTADDHGPGVYACTLIATAHPTWRVNCLQTEIGGTAIATWMPGQVNYRYMMDTAARYLPAGVKVDAILWWQGESDARDTFDPDWNAKFTTICAQWRQDFNQPDLPIIWTELGSMGYISAAHQLNWDAFKANQELLTIQAPSMMVKADGAPTVPLAGVHISQEGGIIVGTRYFNAFQQLGGY